MKATTSPSLSLWRTARTTIWRLLLTRRVLTRLGTSSLGKQEVATMPETLAVGGGREKARRDEPARTFLRRRILGLISS
jgi:hypothetical protein